MREITNCLTIRPYFLEIVDDTKASGHTRSANHSSESENS